MYKIECEDKFIEEVFNEFYNEFISAYGDKYALLIFKLLESIKVEKTNYGPLGQFNHQTKSLSYSEQGDVNVKHIIKHELWHGLNYGTKGNSSFSYFSSRYKEKLLETGYIEEEYEEYKKTMKERFKNSPERLKNIRSYEKFLEVYYIGDNENEKWTEWFNSRTNIKNLQDEFIDFGEGFYTKRKSGKSYYDCYLVLSDMISFLIPLEKLLKMYICYENTDSINYSYKDMIEELDYMYSGVLNDEEKKKNGFFYLKILQDTNTIEKNLIKNPKAATLALQSSLDLCLRAYFMKLDNLQITNQIDYDNMVKIFNEIKLIQEHMLWNVDERKMQNLDYIKTLEKIQNKFVEIGESLKKQHPEIVSMIEDINYKTQKSHEKNNVREFIIQQSGMAENDNEFKKVEFSKFIATVGNSGLKGNLYKTLKSVIGRNEWYKYLFKISEKDTENEENPLVKGCRMIENITNEDEFLNTYEYIYSIFAEKLLKISTNKNSEIFLERYKKTIYELERYTLVDRKSHRMLPGLERICDIYNEKLAKYCSQIDEYTKDKKGNVLVGVAKDIDKKLCLKRKVEVESDH